jgi:hypothetical protein
MHWRAHSLVGCSKVSKEKDLKDDDWALWLYNKLFQIRKPKPHFLISSCFVGSRFQVELRSGSGSGLTRVITEAS